MTVSALSAARALCELRGWSVSNLEIQKVLYLAHLYHLGTKGEPLVWEPFEAWDYGPVVPDVYARAKGFGSNAVPNVFHWVPALAEDSPEYATLKEVEQAVRGFSPGRLVDLTHWKDGAWAACYRPGIRGIRIPNDKILAEYHARQALVAS